MHRQTSYIWIDILTVSPLNVQKIFWYIVCGYRAGYGGFIAMQHTSAVRSIATFLIEESSFSIQESSFYIQKLTDFITFRPDPVFLVDTRAPRVPLPLLFRLWNGRFSVHFLLKMGPFLETEFLKYLSLSPLFTDPGDSAVCWQMHVFGLENYGRGMGIIQGMVILPAICGPMLLVLQYTPLYTPFWVYNPPFWAYFGLNWGYFGPVVD